MNGTRGSFLTAQCMPSDLAQVHKNQRANMHKMDLVREGAG